jgi:hypothetical protein
MKYKIIDTNPIMFEKTNSPVDFLKDLFTNAKNPDRTRLIK